MRSLTNLDSTIFSLRAQLKGCVWGWPRHYLVPLKNAGVAQLVEHHLAKVDVASSSLVTRSPVIGYVPSILASIHLREVTITSHMVY